MSRYSCEPESYEMLEELLETQNLETLKKLSKVVMRKPPSRKGDLIAAIAGQFHRGGLRERWGQMDPLTQTALAEIAHGPDDRFHPDRFYAKYGDLPKRYSRDRSYRETHPYTVLDILLPKNTISLDIKKALLDFVPAPDAAAIETIPELPDNVPHNFPRWHPDSQNGKTQFLSVAETERAGAHDLVAVLRLIEAGKVSASKTTNRVSAASTTAILTVLREGDFLPASEMAKTGDTMRPFAWGLLVQAAGLAKLSGSKLALTKAGKATLAKPPHVVIKSVWERWEKNKLLDEFNRINEIKGQNRKGRRGLAAAAPRRAVVNATLALCPPGEWIEIDELFRFFQASGNDFEITRNPWDLYISEPQYGSLGYNGCHAWSVLQGRYLMCLLWEFGATLGLVDVAHIPANWARNDFRDNWGTDDLDALSRYDGLKYIRINPLGAYCLGMTEDYEPAPVAKRPALHVQSNHDIVLADPEYFDAGDGLFLDRICTKAGESTWSLDQSKTLAAIEDGFDIGEIQSFLEAKSDGALPDTLIRLLQETERRTGLVRHAGGAEVFKIGDRQTALHILKAITDKSLCYPAGKNLLIVPTGKITAFRRALRELGYVAPQQAGEK